MGMKAGWLLLALAGSGCAGVQGNLPPGVQGAAANYPPMILGGTVHATDGSDIPLACAAPGARVEQKGGPTFEFGAPTRPIRTCA